jgi:hypothetical protein
VSVNEGGVAVMDEGRKVALGVEWKSCVQASPEKPYMPREDFVPIRRGCLKVPDDAQEESTLSRVVPSGDHVVLVE